MKKKKERCAVTLTTQIERFSRSLATYPFVALFFRETDKKRQRERRISMRRLAAYTALLL